MPTNCFAGIWGSHFEVRSAAPGHPNPPGSSRPDGLLNMLDVGSMATIKVRHEAGDEMDALTVCTTPKRITFQRRNASTGRSTHYDGVIMVENSISSHIKGTYRIIRVQSDESIAEAVVEEEGDWTANKPPPPPPDSENLVRDLRSASPESELEAEADSDGLHLRLKIEIDLTKK